LSSTNIGGSYWNEELKPAFDSDSKSI
jgi:hypothetical protein